jgi:hypothetical protein
MTFRRSLSEKALKRFQEEREFVEFLNAVKQDPELAVELRGNHIDVYHAGFVVFSLGSSGRLQVGSPRSDKLNPAIKDWAAAVPTSLEELDVDDIPSYVEKVKEIRKHRVESGMELGFELLVARANHHPDSKLLPLDRQIAKPGGGGNRMDLLMYDIHQERLVLTELKLAVNEELRKEVFDQIERYRNLFKEAPEIAVDYKNIFRQKRDLGLIEHDVASIRTESEPLLLLLVANYGHEVNKEKAVLSAALKNKPEHLEIHVRHWKGMPQELSSYRFEHGVAQLPSFEDWAQSLLRDQA